MSANITIALAFTSGVLIVYAINLVVTDLFQRDKEELRRRMLEEAELRQREAARNQPLFQKKELNELAEEAWEETVVDSPTLRDRLREMVEQSGLNLTVKRLLSIAAGSGGVIGLLTALASKNALVAGSAGLLSAALPLMYVQMKR